MNPKDRASDSDINATDVIRARYDWASTSPSIAIVETVAIAADAEPDSLDPLYGYINPDAVDALFQRHAAVHTDASLTVSFTYEGYTVTLESNGDLAVHPLDE